MKNAGETTAEYTMLAEKLHSPITPENAHLLREAKRLGRGRVTGSAWLDAQTFSVSTPIGMWEYTTSGDEREVARFDWKMLNMGDVSVAYNPAKTMMAAIEGHTSDSPAKVHVWDRVAGKKHFTLIADMQPRNTLLILTFSPDGTMLAGWSPLVTFVWDVATGREIRRWQTEFIGIPPFVRFQFSPDNQYLLLAFDTVLVMDIAGGGIYRLSSDESIEDEEAKALLEFATRLNSQSLNPGDKLYARVEDNGITLLEKASGRELRHIPPPGGEVKLPGHFHKLRFSPDGRLFAWTASWYDAIHVWEVSSGRELLKIEQPLSTSQLRNWYSAIDFTPDSSGLVSAHHSGLLCIHDIASGKERVRLEKTAEKFLGFSPDNEWLAVLGADYDVNLVHLESGTIHRFQHGHFANANRIVLNPETGHLTTGAADYWARLWDIETGHQLRTVAITAGRDGPGYLLSHNGQYVTSSIFVGDTNYRWVINIETGQEILKIPDEGRMATAFSRDNRHLLTLQHNFGDNGSFDRSSGAVEIATGRSYELYRTTSEALISSMTSTERSWQFIVRRLPGIIQVAEPTTGIIRLNIKIDDSQYDFYRYHLFSEDRRYFVLQDKPDKTTGVVQIWDIFSGKRVAEFVGAHFSPRCLSADNRFLVISRDARQPALVAEVRSGRIYGELEERDYSHYVFMKHSPMLVSAGNDDGVVRCYGLPDLQRLNSFKAHQGGVKALKLIADDTMLVTGGEDGTVRLWSVPVD